MRYSNNHKTAGTLVPAIPFQSGFVPCPMALIAALTPEQIVWQQSIYQKAYAEARAAVGFPVFVPTFDREARN